MISLLYLSIMKQGAVYCDQLWVMQYNKHTEVIFYGNKSSYLMEQSAAMFLHNIAPQRNVCGDLHCHHARRKLYNDVYCKRSWSKRRGTPYHYKAIIIILLASHPLVQHKLMWAGGDYWLLVIQLTSQFDYLTALLKYLNLEGARLCSLFSKSEGTSTP